MGRSGMTFGHSGERGPVSLSEARRKPRSVAGPGATVKAVGFRGGGFGLMLVRWIAL